MAGRPCKYETAQQLEAVIIKYWEDLKFEQPPTVTGLALALDMSRQNLIDYQNKDEFLDTIKKAKQQVEQFNEERLISGNSVAGIIFNLKNNFNWKDKTEQEVSSTVKTVYIEQEEKQANLDHIYSVVPKITTPTKED